MAEGYPREPAVGAFRIRKLAHAFSKRGHDVTVVVALAGDSASPVDMQVDVRPLMSSIVRVSRKLNLASPEFVFVGQ